MKTRLLRLVFAPFDFRPSTRWISAALLAGLICLSFETPAQEHPKPPSKFKDYGEVTKDTTRYDGLFTLFRTNETVYAELKPNQFDQPLLAPIAIAKGLAMAGQPLNFGDEWILVFRRVGDNVRLVRRNIHYEAPKGTPLEKAVQQNYTDSVLVNLPIVSLSPSGGVLIDFSQIFLSDFAQLGLGEFDRNRSSWHKIKPFANNLELEIEATYNQRGMRGFRSGDDGLADPRGITLVIHYSLCKLPDPGYKPRFADHRVGHFLSATKDFGSSDPDSVFMRRINRWRLEKADPKAKLSPPKKQLVWWVEDTVPHEYRPYVEQGILEWNKAFEKIGFRSAIGVRWQNERDDFDPEDINYCTFRWITTSSTFAMSGLRADPITGEMIDGDVIFDASWIRALKSEYAFLVGKPIPTGAEATEDWLPLAQGEIISPILAAKCGYGLPFPIPRPVAAMEGPGGRSIVPELIPAEWSPIQLQLNRRFSQGQSTVCQCAIGKQQELSMAAIAMAAEGKAAPDEKLPDEFLGQTIKEIVMHEVGHSLGLRHNFKASTMLPLEKVNDTTITHAKGMVGSVMDYNPVNISRKGQPQGDYATPTIGPYDYWAIEYAYKPIEGDEAAELKKIASRSPDGDLAYGTDEDMFLNDDPYVNTYDLGNDPLKYGEDRAALAGELIKTLDDKIVKDGESWARVRRAFSVLFSQYGNAAHLASAFIGGQTISRDFKGGENGHDPITPIPGEKQREALEFLSKNIMVGDAFHFSPVLLRRLTTDNWSHWGSESLFYGGGVDYPIFDRVLAVQRLVLNRCFDPGVLSRLQNQELQSNKDAKPLKMSEVFQTMTDAIWGQSDAAKDSSTATMRRNLQREHLARLCRMVIGQRGSPYGDMYSYVVFLGNSRTPADAKSLARYHLQRIGDKIDRSLNSNSLDDTTRAHLAECREQIKKVLDANYQANEF
jgi:hypothetical protein